MTSQESLNKSVIRHGFKIALKRNVLVTSLASILLVVVMGIPAIRHFTMYFGDKSIGCVFADKRIAILYLIIAAVIGIIQALVSFNFIYNRSAVNTYFSIGIKRSQLFNTRVLAGAFHTFLSILLPIAVVAEINLIYSTSVNLILGHAVLLILGMFTTAFIAFSITVIVCSSTYTRIEGITYSLLANLLPTLILTGLNGFMSAFLWGNTYLGGMRWYHEYYNSLLIRFTEINPLLFLKEYFSELVVQRAPGTDIFNTVPMFLHVVLMLVAAGILIYFSKKIFIKRNIENTKIIGTSNAIAYIVISPAIFAGFSAFLYFTRTGYGQIPITTALLLGAVLSSVIFSALVFPLRVAGKKILNKLLFYLFNLIMCFIVIGIMVSGGLGYVNHMPKSENIESIEISYRGIPDMILTDGMSGGTGAYLFENNGVIKLTNPEDINLAMTLHEKFATQGWILKTQKSNNNPEETVINNMVQVFYNLKNGTKVQRLYPITTLGLMKEMLVLDETETVKEFYNALFNGNMEVIESMMHQEEGRMVRMPSFPIISGKIYIKDPLSRTIHLIGTSAEIENEIKQALMIDFAESSYNEKYFPNESDEYQLYFVSNQEGMGKDIIVSPHTFHGMRVTLSVNSTYKNTISVIEKYYEPEQYEIEMMYVSEFNNPGSLISSEDHSSFYMTRPLGAENIQFWLPKNHIEITDTEDFEEIYELTRGIYHISNGGYLVHVKVKGEAYFITRYIPRDLLPTELKEKLVVN